MSTPTPETNATPTDTAAEARTGDIRLLMEQVVKSIVESPESVFVDEVKRTGASLELEIEVAQKDIGKVIGKQGRTIRSLRALAQAAGAVQNLRCTLELLEEDDLEDDVADDGGGDDSGPQPGNTA